MGNCAVCDSTASRSDEFVVNRSHMSRLSSQVSQRKELPLKENQQGNLDEEQKLALQASNSRMFVNEARSSSLKNSPRQQSQGEEPSNFNYRKDFPIFTISDVIGCIYTDYLSDFETETAIYTG